MSVLPGVLLVGWKVKLLVLLALLLGVLPVG